MNGAQRIAAERQRQIDEEGYVPGHDLAHKDGSLAYAAACYASPNPLFHVTVTETIGTIQRGVMSWHETWPHGWNRPERATTQDERIRELEKAGALVAAEIDRLLAVQDV